MTVQRRADLMLSLVTLFWGLTFPLIRISVKSFSPSQFVVGRFLIALVLFLPFLFRVKGLREELKRFWRSGALLGFIAWTSYQSQTLGLRTVGAGRGAFITGTSIVFVPLLAPLFGAQKPGLRDWMATLGALAGLYLLTDPLGHQSSGTGAHTLSGDLWILVCALGVAVYILLLPRLTARRKPDPSVLTFLQIASVAVIATVTFPLFEPETHLSLSALPLEAWIGIGFCATFATIGTFYLQTRYQPLTSPSRTALIFTLEPVFASVFGYWLLGESFTATGMVGAALVLGSILLTELWPKKAVI